MQKLIFRKKTSHLPWVKKEKKTHITIDSVKKVMLKVYIALFIFIGIASVAGITIWLNVDTPLTSPLSAATTFRFLTTPQTKATGKKVIYGFLPYWNKSSFSIQPELSHLAYFSLGLDSRGNILIQEEDHIAPGYSTLQSESFLDILAILEKNESKVELVITQFNADTIASFLASEKSRNNFFQSLDSILIAYPFTGVNIDFEINGTPSERTRNNLTTFMKELREHLDKRYENMTLSIDMYASAASQIGLWDVEKIAPHVDYIIVMAYDFHQRSSTQAGPVAPLFGADSVWSSSINGYLQDFIAVVPNQKILLGIPFYGYEWQTTSRESQSHTFPDTGATASIKRVNDLLAQKDTLKVQEHWNEVALSPYISYVENGEIYVVYYENSRSISYKLDYVNQLDLGGIAIWALGYEGDSRELWDVIDRKVFAE